MFSNTLELARRQRKNERSRFKRRRDRLFEYSDELGKLFSLKLYLLVQSKEGEFSIYENSEDFPPSRSVSEMLSPYENHTPQSLKMDGVGRASGRARIHSTSKFDRLKNRLLGYANDFAGQFSAKVYLSFQLQSGQMIDYSSIPSKSWPPSKKQVVCSLPLASDINANFL